MRSSGILTVSLAALCSFFPALAYSQVDTVWVRVYNGPGDTTDEAGAIAVDESGNVYVSGSSVGSGTAADYATIKYNSVGDTVWLRRYNGPASGDDRVAAMAVDGAGNVYVAGTSRGAVTGKDYATVKYSPDGVEQWVARYNGPGNDAEQLNAMVVDGPGNVYVTGYSYESGRWSCVTIKYNSSGDTVWLRRYSAAAGIEVGSAIVVDRAGCVCVSGHTGYDYLTMKYSPNGDTLWVRGYEGTGSSIDVTTAIAVDTAGDVYVTGASVGSGTGRDFATVKYSSDRVEQWVARYDYENRDWDWPGDIAVDDSGNVYVTGESGYGAPNDVDYVTIKYNSIGDTVWLRRYNGPGNGFDRGNALALDGLGNVYVTGGSVGSGTSSDCVTIKYDPDGVERWVARYNGSASGDDEAVALALNDSGNVYVTGRSYGSGSFNDYLTIKYAQTGAIEENRLLPLSGRSAPEVHPTIARGSLRLTGNSSPSWLLDATGRKVADLHTGANDVRHLSPGIYFIRENGPGIQWAEGSSVRKVIVAP